MNRGRNGCFGHSRNLPKYRMNEAGDTERWSDDHSLAGSEIGSSLWRAALLIFAPCFQLHGLQYSRGNWLNERPCIMHIHDSREVSVHEGGGGRQSANPRSTPSDNRLPSQASVRFRVRVTKTWELVMCGLGTLPVAHDKYDRCRSTNARKSVQITRTFP